MPRARFARELQEEAPGGSHEAPGGPHQNVPSYYTSGVDSLILSGSCATPTLGGPDDHMFDILPWEGGGGPQRGERRRGVTGERGEEVRPVEDEEEAKDDDGEAEKEENQDDRY